RDALRDEEAAVHAAQTDGVDPEVAQAGDELAVDDAAQDGRGDFQRLGVRDPEAAFEPAGHAKTLEPLGDPLAAAMNEHHGPTTRDRGHVRQHVRLIGYGRATEFDDEDLAHVVYSEFSITYASVRSQPKASPMPSPSPRSSSITSSGAFIDARAAARSNASG